MSFTDPFGGIAVSVAPISYTALELTELVTELVWPGYVQDSQVAVAAKMDIESAVPGAVLVLPDARAASPGEALLFTNLAINDVEIQSADAVTLLVVAAGQSRLLYLTDNSTVGGSWRAVLYGVGLGALDAGAAAGYGLSAFASQLQVSLPAVAVAAPFTVGDAFRGANFVWTGGSDTGTLPLAATVGAGFVFAIRNEGTGTLTLATSGGQLVDAALSVILQPQESCFVTTNGVDWFTVGRGRNQQFNFSLLIKAVTGGVVTLTPAEASNVVQRYTGTLTSNCTVKLPPVVQIYYVSNQTSGAFTLTFETTIPGTSVVLPAGQNTVLFCDGVDVINNTTSISGIASLALSPGSVSAPPLTFSGDLSTGLYRPVAGSTALVGNGTEVLRATGQVSAVNYVLLQNALAGAAPTFFAQGPAADIGLTLASKGIGEVRQIVNGNVVVATTSNGVAVRRGSVSGSYGPGAVATNLAVGDNALSANTTGGETTTVGVLAGASQTTGNRNTALGAYALTANVLGSDNTALGANTLRAYSAAAGSNVAVGSSSLRSLTTGQLNVSVGAGAMFAATTLGGTVAVGFEALSAVTSGTGNTAVGYRSLRLVETGTDNTAVGSDAMRVTTGGFNTAVGSETLSQNTTGIANVAVGRRALATSVSSNSNVAIGFGAMELLSSGGGNNVVVGTSAGHDMTTGSNNIAIGSSAMYGVTSGASNLAIGSSALLSVGTGQSNIAIGASALNLATGSSNAALGSRALIALGVGSHNLALGTDAGLTLTSGSGNVIVGGATSGYGPVFAFSTESDRVAVGHVGVTNAYIQVAWTVVSDARDKTEVEDLALGLDFVKKLKPKSYRMRAQRGSAEATGPRRYGFLAQDVLAAEGGEPVIVDADDPEKLRYTDAHLVAVLTNALIELSEKFDRYVESHP